MRLEQEAGPHTIQDVPQPPAGDRKTLGGSTVRRSYPARRSGGKTMFLPSGEWQQQENAERHNAHLHKALRTLSCGPSGRLERERRAADERTGRNGSRPEDLTTERRTIQRELQQVRHSTRCRKSSRPRERAGEVQKRPAKKSKIARESKKGMPTGSIFSCPTTDTRGRSRPK